MPSILHPWQYETKNVLLTLPNKDGKVQAKISDFGLSRQRKPRRSSIMRSGIRGTYGWTALEMLDGMSSTSFPMDIFSLGCVFYYTLTVGKHPFGEYYDREGNIKRGQPSLIHLNAPADETARGLLTKMIEHDPTKRPSAVEVENSVNTL